MKHSVWHLAMYVIAVIVAFIITLQLTACDHFKQGDFVKEDSVKVANQIEGIVNPQFGNVSEVLSYKDELNANEYEDSVFRHMNPTLAYNIATIVINRDGVATKSSIVKEYEKGKQIYDNLPQTIPDSITHPQEVDGHKAAEITSKDTTIGGKKVHIKTIKEYE